MGRFVKGDVVVLPFPFSDLSASKKRPALVLATIQPHDDLILCMITSRATKDASAVPLSRRDFMLGGLPSDSNVRKMKVHIDNYAAALDRLKNELKLRTLPAGPLAPNEFQSRLRQASTRKAANPVMIVPKAYAMYCHPCG